MDLGVMTGATTLSMAAVVLWWTVAGGRRVTRLAARNLQLGLDVRAGSRRADMREQLLAAPASERVVLPFATRVARRSQALMPGQTSRLNQRILTAGMSSKWPLERTMAVKVIGGLLCVPVAFLLVSSGNVLGMFYGLMLPPLVYMAPDLLLRMKAKRRQHQIQMLLPDTLDQVTVCVEAGLGFEAAMARSATTGTGPLAEEISRTLQDVQFGVPRQEAMRRLADRNDVGDLRRFVLAILQAEGYGVPIARVLRIQASELREKRRQAAEEKAMKVSIKMLFPLVTCILPTVFIVILSPAIFSLMDAFSSTAGG